MKDSTTVILCGVLLFCVVLVIDYFDGSDHDIPDHVLSLSVDNNSYLQGFKGSITLEHPLFKSDCSSQGLREAHLLVQPADQSTTYKCADFAIGRCPAMRVLVIDADAHVSDVEGSREDYALSDIEGCVHDMLRHSVLEKQTIERPDKDMERKQRAASWEKVEPARLNTETGS